MNLESRIDEIIDEFPDVEFQSARLYQFVQERLSKGIEIDGTDPVIRDATRKRMKAKRGKNGRRQFQNAHFKDEDGKTQHLWIQMELADFSQAKSIVDRSASMAISMVRESNNLAIEAQDCGHQIPLPFPWLKDEAAA